MEDWIDDSMRNSNPLLLEELIYEILLRVPADSLVRQCKLVCRTWRTLIDDPTFVVAHAFRETDCSGFLLRRYHGYHVAEYNDETATCFEVSKHAIKHYLDDALKFDHPELVDLFGHQKVVFLFDHPEIVGSCNGLVCFCKKPSDGILDMTVVNPLTRKYVKIPTCNYSFNSKVLYGFGYDPLTEKYKIVTVFYDKDSMNFQAYTLGSGRWRCAGFKLGIDDDTVPLQGQEDDDTVPFQGQEVSSRGMLVDGAIHWIYSLTSTIISFDLAKEEFGGLPLDFLHDGWNHYCKLGVLEGCLSVKRVSDQNPESFDIWILKQPSTTWIKRFNVVLPSEVSWRANCTPVASVATTGNILLIASTRNSLVCYDPKTANCKFVKANLSHDIISYRKTLLSPKSVEEACGAAAEVTEQRKLKRKREEI